MDRDWERVGGYGRGAGFFFWVPPLVFHWLKVHTLAVIT